MKKMLLNVDDYITLTLHKYSVPPITSKKLDQQKVGPGGNGAMVGGTGIRESTDVEWRRFVIE